MFIAFTKKSQKQKEEHTEVELLKTMGKGISESNNPILTNSNNNNKNQKKFTFTTGNGITQEVFIEPDKKIKDLIAEYFNQIKQPELIKDKDIVFLGCGTKIDNSNYDQKISEFGKKNGVDDGSLAFLVIDDYSKIKNS